MKRTNFEGRREQRRADAANRQAARNARGDAGQLARLDESGHRALKERMRLREAVR